MKNTLIFLHSKGADKNAYSEFMGKLAKKYDANLYAFNAPYRHKDGYRWFDKQTVGDKKIILAETFDYSLNYILAEIQNLNIDYNNLIICGHSQGGAMAIAVGLCLPVQKIISICGDWSYDIPMTKNQAKRFVWVEGGKDTYISDDRKNSYKILINKGIKLDYIYDIETEHTVFSNNLIEKL